MSVVTRLSDMGIELPQAAAPVASYVPLMVLGRTVHISGQLPFVDGKLVSGKLGSDLGTERGKEAARACALMILAQLEQAELLDRVERIVKLNVFVASSPEFSDQPKVANGASDLMVEVFGDAGKHARAAVGVAALPLGAAVEVDAIVALKA
ncbi:RidA family protein [Qipengyuania sp.]|uniref:RidA family protein n=1 Tax=Qipengyuania sp. TaxID=2004515 RepID=UPI0035C7AAAB